MEQTAFSRLASFAQETTRVNSRPVMGPSEQYKTMTLSDGSPAFTVTRPRVLDHGGLFTVNAIDGTLLGYAVYGGFAEVVGVVRAFIRADSGLKDYGPRGLESVIEEAEERATRETEHAKTLTAPESRKFKAASLSRVVRASRRASLARDMLQKITAPAPKVTLCRTTTEARAIARLKGEEAEERADSLTGEARAKALEEAAGHYDRAGGTHWPQRAATLRQEAATAKAPTLESIVQEHEATVNIAPTWSGIMPGLIAALMNGTAEGRTIATEELMKLAAQVDRINGRSVGAMENPEAPAPRKARLKSRKELEDMARDQTARPIARELASMALAVASCGQSGGFPLYAFRDSRPLSPDELDSLIYDQEGAFQ